MSANIQRAGYPMIVYDLREEAARPLLEGGARLANSPAEVAAASDITFTSLPGHYEVETVATGADGVAGGHPTGQRVHRSVVQPAHADPGDRAQVPGQGLPCAGRAGERRQDRGGVGEPGGDGGRRPGGVLSE